MAANGTTMAKPRREGYGCMLKMQVTDVQRPLISVSRICEAGHQVYAAWIPSLRRRLARKEGHHSHSEMLAHQPRTR